MNLEGATIYELNENGTNKWSANVQQGYNDNGERLTFQECCDVAASIHAMKARIAELEAQLKANTLKKIMFEYEAAKEDSSFDREHPIFQMAAHIDSLEAQLKTAKRDGMLEAISHIKNLSGQPLTEHGVVHMLTRYANNPTGE